MNYDKEALRASLTNYNNKVLDELVKIKAELSGIRARLNAFTSNKFDYQLAVCSSHISVVINEITGIERNERDD